VNTEETSGHHSAGNSVAAVLNFTALHLIVWPQPSSGVTQCPFLSQLNSTIG